jgi:hypothetical protein
VSLAIIIYRWPTTNQTNYTVDISVLWVFGLVDN